MPDVLRSAWVWESVRLAQEAAELRERIAPSFAVVLAFGLCMSTLPIAPAWSSIKALTDDLDDSSPSLYLFERGSEGWKSLLSGSLAIETPPFLKDCREARYREVWEEQDREYIRSLLLIQ
jgi:hypothetical protein